MTEKIIIADDLPSSAIDLLRQVDGWTVDARSGRSPSELGADLTDASALIIRSATQVNAGMISGAPRLRVIARAGTGIDNVDVDAASARGILVMNAPGGTSISVAELTCGLMLSLARRITAADAAMKQGRWEKQRFAGAELRGKVLGLVGLGRIGQEVAQRARPFDMGIVAHDPFISPQVAADIGVELVSLEELCAQADYVSLHVPLTPETRQMFNAERLARCKPGVRLINTARGDLIDEVALVDALRSGQVAGAALDVFAQEPLKNWQLASLPQVIATPHIAASTVEAQELVGLDTATAVRDFLRDGAIRNAVNFPAVPFDEFKRLQPFMVLAERLGSLVAQTGPARIEAIGIRYYGEVARANGELLASAVVAGALKPILSAVTLINARKLAAGRGVEVIESRSSRQRNFTSVMSVKVHGADGERWVEGTVFDHGAQRLVLIDGVAVEAPLEGSLLIICNEDRPGVIGEVGTILGRHAINIANFALGRGASGAIGVVNVDEAAVSEKVLKEIRAVSAIRQAWLVRL